MIIYTITNLLNGKVYVGKTQRTLEERLGEHYRGHLCYIDRAIAKYKVENFRVEIIEECSTIEELNEREQYWIKIFDCRAPKGYNLTDGGEGSLGHKTPPDVLARLTELRRGRKLSEEHKAKISATLKGKVFSEETKAKISAAKMGHSVSEETERKLANANLGKKASAETRAKMSASSRSKRAIRCVETNEIFLMVKDAMEWAHVSRVLLWRACKDQKHTAAGYHWQYVD